VPVSFKEQPEDSGGARYVPDAERMRRVVGLARRQIALRHKPNVEKRIAVIFTNSSAKAARAFRPVFISSPSARRNSRSRLTVA